MHVFLNKGNYKVQCNSEPTKINQLNNEIENHVFFVQNMCLHFLQCHFLPSHEVIP
jgi:hypothetical protein